MATSLYNWTEIGASTTGVHALHDEAINQIEGFLGEVLDIAVDDASTSFAPTTAQCRENAIFKFNDDGSSPPDAYIFAELDLTNMVNRVFHVWNNTTNVTVYVDSSLTGYGVLNGEINSFYYDGTDVYPINPNNDRLMVARVAGEVADVTGSVYTGLDAAETVDGVNLDYGDWVLFTDYEHVVRTPATSTDGVRNHPFNTDNEVTTGKRCRITAGTYAGQILIFNGTTWEVDTSISSLATVDVVVGGFVAGTPTANARIFDQLEIDGIDFADDFSGSLAELRTAPSGGSIVFSIQVDDVAIGTLTFADAATTGVFATTSGAESVDSGETLSIVAPADLRSAADLTFSMKGTAQ